MRHLIACLGVGVLLFVSPASAEDESDPVDWPTWWGAETVEAVTIVLEDQVKDGCWARPEATKTALELVLRQSGIPVVDSPGRWRLETPDPRSVYSCHIHMAEVGDRYLEPHFFNVRAIGSYSGNSCIVALGISLTRCEAITQRRGDEEWLDTKNISYFDTVGVAGLSRSESQNGITSMSLEILRSIANDVLTVRSTR